MKKAQSLFDITSIDLKKLEYVFDEWMPDIVIVQGNSIPPFTSLHLKVIGDIAIWRKLTKFLFLINKLAVKGDIASAVLLMMISIYPLDKVGIELFL